MKEYRLNEETWKLILIALNSAPHYLVKPALEKIEKEAKYVILSTEQTNEQNDSSD